MEYGNWKDWLLCLGIIILLEVRLPRMVQRNPEGHSPRWWKKHPQAKPKLESVSETTTPPLPEKSFRQKLWGWQVLAWVIALFIGGGMSLMSSLPLIADGLYLAGFGLTITKLLTSTEHRRPSGILAGTLAIVFISVVAGNHRVNRLYPFQASASVATVAPSVPTADEVQKKVSLWLTEVGTYRQLSIPNPPGAYWALVVGDQQNRVIKVAQFTASSDRVTVFATLYGGPKFDALPKKEGDKVIGIMKRGFIQMDIHYGKLEFPIRDAQIDTDVPVSSAMSGRELVKAVDKIFGAVAYTDSAVHDAIER